MWADFQFTTLSGTAGIDSPNSVAVDSGGNVYAAQSEANVILKITPTGVVTVFAGSVGTLGTADGLGADARFSFPQALTVDGVGNVYVADTGNNAIRKITPAGLVSTFAGTAGAGYGSLDGTGASAQFHFPYGVAIDSGNNLYVADTFNHTIRKITSLGVVTTLCGGPGISGSTNGSGTGARFSFPRGVAVNSLGEIFVADTANHIIRKITSAGVVTTVAGTAGMFGNADGAGAAARFAFPHGVALDASGNIYVADTFNNSLRKVTVDGATTTIGGAPSPGNVDAVGTNARFSSPDGLATDTAGNLYVADTGNSSIRKGTLIIIPTAPTIAEQPSNQTISAGQGVHFSVVANGPPAPTYQWKKNGLPIIGATETSLTISSATVADAGVYTVIVTNSAGSIASDAAVLTVTTTSSSLPTPMADQTVSPTQSAAFTVGVGSPQNGYQWQRLAAGESNWTDLVDSGIYMGVHTATLVVKNATLLMNGDQFRCVVSNGTSSATGNAVVLSVVIPQTWLRSVLLMNRTSAASEVVLGNLDPAWRIATAGDFNGDGKSDIIWQNSVTGEHSLWLMNGTTRSATVDLGTTDPTWQMAGTGDFNGDGKSDILWQNVTTGQHSIWLMNGAVNIGSIELPTTDPIWRMIGTGDFNGDGQTDILWQNIITGQHSIWLMSGTTNIGNIELGTTEPTWLIAGTGDFNGDGQTDILWQNTITGQMSLWLMNGTTVIGSTDFGTADPSWQAAGVGDFNGDAKVDVIRQKKIDVRNDLNGDGFTDILWQNSVTGQHSIWLMNGTTYLGGFELGTTNPTWQIAGSGDFNADGQTDILWHNLQTGQHSLWLMRGTTYIGGVDLETTAPAWQIGSTGDFNGDGQTDILFQNVATGQKSLWLMSGTTHTSTVDLGTVGSAWEIVGTGDFDADGHIDILWQNIVTGEHTIWLMTGAVHTGTVDLGTTSLAWQMAGTGDFNGDGAIDILWQNTITGQHSVWLMRGTTNVGNIELGTTDSAWTIVN